MSKRTTSPTSYLVIGGSSSRSFLKSCQSKWAGSSTSSTGRRRLRRLLGNAQHLAAAISRKSLHPYTFRVTATRTSKQACRRRENCKTQQALTLYGQHISCDDEKSRILRASTSSANPFPIWHVTHPKQHVNMRGGVKHT